MSASLSAFLPQNLHDVKGTVVLVTGGGSGLGRAISTGFAVNGAKVYIVGRRLESLNETKSLFEKDLSNIPSPGSIHVIQGSVSDKESIEAIREKFQESESHLDVLVNCAGVMKTLPTKYNPGQSTLEEIEQSLWSADWDDFKVTNEMNISSLYFVTVAFLSLLKKSTKASVCNIASIAPWNISQKNGSVSYGASKAGAIQITKMLASRLSPFSIRVNAVCPGIFPSEMTGSTEELTKKDNPWGNLIATIPLERPGAMPEIFGTVLYLSSPAGAYCHGSVLVVDGGRTLTLHTLA